MQTIKKIVVARTILATTLITVLSACGGGGLVRKDTPTPTPTPHTNPHTNPYTNPYTAGKVTVGNTDSFTG
ncbi:hypothetical protein XFRB_01825 [Xylella fastidiosa]|uniref:hypothetical protein n=1 Tax=Xylella fastidiosa TaxID=2371 RepID=UPI001EB2C48A|nr:hypothetical protein [Xylella fastidiosa]